MNAIGMIQRDMANKFPKLKKNIRKLQTKIDKAVGIHVNESGETIFEPITDDEFDNLWGKWFDAETELRDAVTIEYKKWEATIK